MKYDSEARGNTGVANSRDVLLATASGAAVTGLDFTASMPVETAGNVVSRYNWGQQAFHCQITRLTLRNLEVGTSPLAVGPVIVPIWALKDRFMVGLRPRGFAPRCSCQILRLSKESSKIMRVDGDTR